MDRGLRLLLHAWQKHQTGRSWVTEGKGMAPQVSSLAQAFLSTTRRCVSLSILWECWPLKHNIAPRQPVDEVQAHITQYLDEVATQSPSYIVWDIFAWPDSNKNCWKEDCLPTPQFNGRPQLKNAGDLVGVT